MKWQRFPLNVTTIGGFEEITATPGLTLTNKGQLAEQKDPEEPVSERPTFQDVTGQPLFPQNEEDFSAASWNWSVSTIFYPHLPILLYYRGLMCPSSPLKPKDST